MKIVIKETMMEETMIMMIEEMMMEDTMMEEMMIIMIEMMVRINY